MNNEIYKSKLNAHYSCAKSTSKPSRKEIDKIHLSGELLLKNFKQIKNEKAKNKNHSLRSIIAIINGMSRYKSANK